MASVQATVEMPIPADQVYSYLLHRYDGQQYRASSMATKGYVPLVKCIENIPKQTVGFEVPGRDPVLRMFVKGWRWVYHIESDAAASSRVTIRYEWSFLVAMLSAGTARHQACNEITQTVMALEALAAANAA
jgi:hypothetical protein